MPNSGQYEVYNEDLFIYLQIRFHLEYKWLNAYGVWFAKKLRGYKDRSDVSALLFLTI